MEVVVEHDYIAKEPNELTITKGDIIKDVVKKIGGWWEGSLRDKKGLFPDNFVRILDKDTVVLRNKKDASRIRQCRVVFSYQQDHDDELTLKVGDIIDILGEEEEGWWRGLLHGKQGVFPSNFVEEIQGSKENLPDLCVSPTLPAKPSKVRCEVKYAYKAQNEDELTLKEGDIVTLLSKDGQDPGWWKGDLNGVVGVFPDNFVAIIEEKATARDDKLTKSCIEPSAAPKPNATNVQRKSLEFLNNEKSPQQPPVPSKKPAVAIKKSPSGSGSLFQGLKKKIADAVDGATGSKVVAPVAPKSDQEESNENAFDDVVRRPLLGDLRASRPKAPGRRLPSVMFKDSEPGVVNGNADHSSVAMETSPTPGNTSPEIDTTDSQKPKLREWEKHKAPWLAEMKLNQAKRTSVSPGPENKLRLSQIANNTEPEAKTTPETSNPIDIPKAAPAPSSGNRMKTPPSDSPMIRARPTVPAPARPQTIHTANVIEKAPPPIVPSKIHQKPPTTNDNSEAYQELVQRIAKLEELIEKQKQDFDTALDELRGRLQIETELRMKFQEKFNSFVLDEACQDL